jgi:hypothetical protein
MEETVRWSIKVSRETDLTLRTYLGARGMKKGDLSKFIEEAVRWRILSRTVRDIKGIADSPLVLPLTSSFCQVTFISAKNERSGP